MSGLYCVERAIGFESLYGTMPIEWVVREAQRHLLESLYRAKPDLVGQPRRFDCWINEHMACVAVRLSCPMPPAEPKEASP